MQAGQKLCKLWGWGGRARGCCKIGERTEIETNAKMSRGQTGQVAWQVCAASRG